MYNIIGKPNKKKHALLEELLLQQLLIVSER